MYQVNILHYGGISCFLQVITIGKHVKGYHYIIANLVSIFNIKIPVLLMLIFMGAHQLVFCFKCVLENRKKAKMSLSLLN